MAKSMTKSSLIAHLATKTALSKKAVAGVLEHLATLAAKEAKNGFQIPDLGKLVLRNRAARMGRNPQTGEPIKIPAKRVVRFRVSKALKDAVLGKK
ncbi:MAG: HU family DNA-binding protein [candidate division NC10 bacterium]